ncbi:MAG: hypothetical protein ACRDIB_18175, partial [Ardenticatenaceae bacterium]
MHPKHAIRIVVVILFILAGGWLLFLPTSVPPESALRSRVARQAMAPAAAHLSPREDRGTGEPKGGPQAPIESVTVSLDALPPDPDPTDSQYERWLRGEIDLEKEYRVGEAEAAALKAAAARLQPNGNIQQVPQEGADPSAPDPAGVDFDSLDVTDCCGGGGGAVVPPDPLMAAGPDHLIAVVNLAFEIYDKSGNSLFGPTTFDSFFAAQPNCSGTFDPTALYDEEADRYILGVDGAGTHFCTAVSATNDPLGAWHLYAVPASFSGEFHDYPHTGVGEHAIYVGANQFGGGIPGGFEGRVWALDKAAMYAGDPMTPITFSTGGTQGTPQPLILHGFQQGTWPDTDIHYFITDPYDGETLTLWEWPDALGGGIPTVVATFDLAAATGVPGGFPVDVPQMGGAEIQANDWRFRGFEYRNGSGWAADTISCNPGGGTVD